MKNKKTILKGIAAAVIAAFSISSSNAQSNLGAACGCPTPVSSRPTVLLSTLATVGGAGDGELIANNVILDCSKTWILDKKIYVAPGKTLTIQPGTVIQAQFQAAAANAVALTVEVGGKIFASGTEDCQIVFTAVGDNLDGTYGINQIGKWGGICIAGKATNNLTLAANGPFVVGTNGKIAVADGLGTFEGFASTNTKDQFGVNLTTGGVFDDNDNSGILKYVSIRHTGAILVQGGELNALSLGSVGRGTTIEHIEIVSGADDGIELWGGTVNLKYCSFLFGNDDNLDYDCGWTGNAQFIFILKNSDLASSPDSDNGFEMDADDNKSNLLPRSHPVIYNVTAIGNSKVVTTADNQGMAALSAKELTEGEVYNSVFANWRYGLNLVKTLGTRAGASEAYHNWSATAGNGSQSLKVKCNTFTGIIQKAIAIDKNGTGVATNADSTQFFTTDMNENVASIPGFSSTFVINSSTNAITTKPDVTPSPALSVVGCPVAPVNGFFTVANYRGAFAPNAKPWISDWSYAAVLGATSGLAPCPTDLNSDGITNTVDFLQLLGQFNVSCN